MCRGGPIQRHRSNTLMMIQRRNVMKAQTMMTTNRAVVTRRMIPSLRTNERNTELAGNWAITRRDDRGFNDSQPVGAENSSGSLTRAFSTRSRERKRTRGVSLAAAREVVNVAHSSRTAQRVPTVPTTSRRRRGPADAQRNRRGGRVGPTWCLVFAPFVTSGPLKWHRLVDRPGKRERPGQRRGRVFGTHTRRHASGSSRRMSDVHNLPRGCQRHTACPFVLTRPCRESPGQRSDRVFGTYRSVSPNHCHLLVSCRSRRWGVQ